jgi:hypothetical protein
LAWQPNTIYVSGQMVLGLSGGVYFFQLVTTGGTSGNTYPIFNSTFGSNTTDNTVTWTNQGSPLGIILYPPTATYNPGITFPIFTTILDPNGFLQMVSVAGTSFPAWIQNHPYTLGQQIIDANGYVQTVIHAGTSGTNPVGSPPVPYYPPFDENLSPPGETQDGTVVWQTTFLYAWNTKVGSLTKDGTITWVNLGPPPGLLAPRLLQAWEIKSDQLNTFEAS